MGVDLQHQTKKQAEMAVDDSDRGIVSPISLVVIEFFPVQAKGYADPTTLVGKGKKPLATLAIDNLNSLSCSSPQLICRALIRPRSMLMNVQTSVRIRSRFCDPANIARTTVMSTFLVSISGLLLSVSGLPLGLVLGISTRHCSNYHYTPFWLLCQAKVRLSVKLGLVQSSEALFS